MSVSETAPTSSADRPRVVCLCGSMRFEDEMRLAAVELSVEGRVVVMPHVNMKRPVPANVVAGRDLKTELDALHFTKIDLADEVLVVCPGNYIGDSTRSEIAYAERTGKRVGYWYGPEDVCPKQTGAHCTHYQEGDGACCACEKQPCICSDAPENCPRHVSAVPATQDVDLREQIPSAIADPGAFVPRAKRHGAGDQYESVPQWAARAVGSLVWPLVAEARAEADMHRRTRLRVERVLDEALGAEEKDGTGEGLAADVRLAITRRDAEIERLRVELEQAEDESAQLRQQVIDERVQATQTSQELFAKWRGERDQARAERDALSSLLRGMARRVGQKRKEIRELSALVPCGWCDGSGVAPEERFGHDADGAPMVDGDQPCPEGCRPPTSDQTPATPDDDAARHMADVTRHPRFAELYAQAAHNVRARDNHDQGDDTAPSSVQGDTTPPHEVDLLRQAAKAAREHGNELRADMFEMAAKDHEDDDCPKGERAECMAVEVARKALAEYATSAPSEGDTTPEEA